jgi:hypothetical protein
MRRTSRVQRQAGARKCGDANVLGAVETFNSIALRASEGSGGTGIRSSGGFGVKIRRRIVTAIGRTWVIGFCRIGRDGMKRGGGNLHAG